MELKSLVYFEKEIDGRKYRLELPAGANLGEAYKMTSDFLDEIIELIKRHQATRKQAEEPKEDECQAESSE